MQMRILGPVASSPFRYFMCLMLAWCLRPIPKQTPFSINRAPSSFNPPPVPHTRLSL